MTGVGIPTANIEKAGTSYESSLRCLPVVLILFDSMRPTDSNINPCNTYTCILLSTQPLPTCLTTSNISEKKITYIYNQMWAGCLVSESPVGRLEKRVYHALDLKLSAAKSSVPSQSQGLCTVPHQDRTRPDSLLC